MSDVFLLGLRREEEEIFMDAASHRINDYVGIKYESGDEQDVSLNREIAFNRAKTISIDEQIKVLMAIDRQKLLLSNNPNEIEKIFSNLY